MEQRKRGRPRKPDALSGAERARRFRARHAPAVTTPPRPRPTDDPAAALARWARRALKVPPGHPAAGRPMALPPWAVEFLRGALAAPGHKAALVCARKNAKSAICAVLALGYLVGPLRTAGWRGAVASLNRTKAALLMRQCEAIACASGLAGLEFRRSPYPGHVRGPEGELVILSADRGAGHAESLDLVLCDETGLMSERDREMLASLVSSTSAKNGRIIHLSIRGDGPFVPELLSDVAVFRTVYAAADGCALDDRSAWRAANPGLGTIKPLAYMVRESAAAVAVPANENMFRAHDLNQAVDPSREMICTQADWRACTVPEDELPPRKGDCTVGFDAGSSASMTAAAAFWPASGRLEVYCGFPATPGLLARGKADFVGDLYQRMHDRGDVKLYRGRVAPLGSFLADLGARLDGATVTAFGADRHRREDVMQGLEDAGLRWRWTPRGTGASSVADGSHDVRAFQRAVLSGRLKCAPNLAAEYSVMESDIRYDVAGNPALGKAQARSRIDAMQATVIACGLGSIVKPRRAFRVHVA